jgi:hypothetical protein
MYDYEAQEGEYARRADRLDAMAAELRTWKDMEYAPNALTGKYQTACIRMDALADGFRQRATARHLRPYNDARYDEIAAHLLDDHEVEPVRPGSNRDLITQHKRLHEPQAGTP